METIGNEMTLNCIGCDAGIPIFDGEIICPPDDWGLLTVKDSFSPSGYAKFCACPDCKETIH